MSNIKNIIIFVVVAVILVLIYIYFIRGTSEPDALVSTSSGVIVTNSTSTDASTEDPTMARDFLTLLLSVKNIKLNDSIFSDPAFATLRDSSIVLTPDGTEGRPNPFAPVGSDSAGVPNSVTTPAVSAPVSQPTPPLQTPVNQTAPASQINFPTAQ
jgi:hypothetical protein